MTNTTHTAQTSDATADLSPQALRSEVLIRLLKGPLYRARQRHCWDFYCASSILSVTICQPLV